MEQAERYEILGKVGEGGLGSVYRAHDRQLNRTVAIKRIHTGGDLDPDEAFRQIQKESHALSALSSTHIVSVYDIDQDEDGPFVVMEYLEGETLDTLVARAPVVEADFISLAEQALEGLLTAHEAGLIHRDIKPGNLMVTWLPSGRSQLKLLDFGLAKFGQEPAVQTIAHGGSLMGSIYFMAPEQFARQPLDTRTDLYSLGCVLYFALTGYYPFGGDNATEVMAGHMQGAFTPASEIRPDVDTRLVDWLARLMAKDQDDRFPSAQAALNELEEIKRTARPTSASQRVLLTPETGPIAQAAAPPQQATSPVFPPPAGTTPPQLAALPRRQGMSPLVITLLSVLVLAVVILILVILLGKPEAPPLVEANPASKAPTNSQAEEETGEPAPQEGDRFFKIFIRKHDQNSDGELGITELPLPGNDHWRPIMKKRFETADANGDGVLDVPELRNSARHLRETGEISDAEDYLDNFRIWDTNSDGLLSDGEYQIGRGKTFPHHAPRHHRIRFERLDLDASGDLSPEEFLLTHLTS